VISSKSKKYYRLKVNSKKIINDVRILKGKIPPILK